MTRLPLRHLLRVREAAVSGIRSHYQAGGLTEVAVPVLVGITGACENVSTLFHLSGGAPVHLTQTGQLALEHALCVEDGVYCQTPSFRTDKIDQRHLSEFTLIEEEICCDHPMIGMAASSYDSIRMFEKLLVRIAEAIKAIVLAVMELAPDSVMALGGDLESLSNVVGDEFLRITYTDAVELLNQEGEHPLVWGSDLGSAEESRLVTLLARESGGRPSPVFVSHYPASIKFFNMKADDRDPDLVQSVDLLLPGVGECVGGAVREHRYEPLMQRLLGSVMFAHITERKLATIDDFMPYLEIIRDGLVSPHAGYGIGLERVLQFILGIGDIRAASVSFAINDMLGFGAVLADAQRGSHAPGF